jgi:hypothetical protein
MHGISSSPARWPGKDKSDGTVAGRCMGRTPSMLPLELEPVRGSCRCSGEAASPFLRCNVAFLPQSDLHHLLTYQCDRVVHMISQRDSCDIAV